MAFNFPGNSALPTLNAGGPPPMPPPLMGTQGMIQAALVPGFMPMIANPGQSQLTPHPPNPGQSQVTPHPSMNDAPLDFNVNKGKPPVTILGPGSNEEQSTSGRKEEQGEPRRDRENRERKDRDDRSREKERDDRSRDRERDSRRSDRERERDPRRGKEREREGDRNGDRPTERKDETSAPEMSNGLLPNPDAVSQGPNPGMVWSGMMPMTYPLMMGMMGDPSIMSLGQHYGMLSGLMPDGSLVPGDPSMMVGQSGPDSGVMKEIIHCKGFTLIPPNPNSALPSTRERPLGCKTVFVGGLPDNCTEEMIREIFERCGEILTIRLSKKNFCHVRFAFESSVEGALYFSGYRMRIGSHSTALNTGRLHIDYAQARDDYYEWECQQRQLQREQRHRDRVEQERLRPPSPPPVPHYSDHEATIISDKIKVEDTFADAAQTLVIWLERGDCSKRNSSMFYSLIQSTNSHVRRLLNEKGQFEEELQKAKYIYKARMQGLLIQFSHIERVFNSASHKKVWDHFSKAQRKNIDLWKKQSMEIKVVQLDDALLNNEEMDLSDNEEDSAPARKRGRRDDNAATDTLKEENDSLRCQLEAYKNEVDLVRAELRGELGMKEAQLKVLQQTLQGLQQKLLEGQHQRVQDEAKIKELTTRLNTLTTSSSTPEDRSANMDLDPKPSDMVDSSDSKTSDEGAVRITHKEARLIGLTSAFLHVHPFGAGVDYVWSYLQKLEPSLRPTEVEALMTRFPMVFRQELSGIGANMERRWQFAGFNGPKSTDNTA